MSLPDSPPWWLRGIAGHLGGDTTFTIPDLISCDGPPSATTLQTGDYEAATPPDLPDIAIDVTNNSIYICTESGTEATSVWTQITASSGGEGGYKSAYTGAAYPAGSIVYFSPTLPLPGAAGGPILFSGTINIPGFYGTANGIGQADNSNAVNVPAQGAHNVPGWPKQNDWELLYGLQVVQACKQNADGTYSYTQYFLCAYPYTS